METVFVAIKEAGLPKKLWALLNKIPSLNNSPTRLKKSLAYGLCTYVAVSVMTNNQGVLPFLASYHFEGPIKLC